MHVGHRPFDLATAIFCTLHVKFAWCVTNQDTSWDLHAISSISGNLPPPTDRRGGSRNIFSTLLAASKKTCPPTYKTCSSHHNCTLYRSLHEIWHEHPVWWHFCWFLQHLVESLRQELFLLQMLSILFWPFSHRGHQGTPLSGRYELFLVPCLVLIKDKKRLRFLEIKLNISRQPGTAPSPAHPYHDQVTTIIELGDLPKMNCFPVLRITVCCWQIVF